MDTEINAVTAIALLNERFDDLLEMAGRVPMQAWDLPTSLPGWSVRDVFAHCAGGERAVMGDSSPNVEVAHLTHVKNAIGAFVEVWVESMRSLTIEELLAEMAKAFDRRRVELAAVTQADFDAPSWTPAGPDGTYGRFMRIRQFDLLMHQHDIATALGWECTGSPGAFALALDEVETALGFIVGKRASWPAGEAASISVDGAARRAWIIDCVGRASLRPVGGEGPEPVAGVVLDTVTFLRLAGGRLDPAVALDDGRVNLVGDRVLADRLARSLSFTI